MDKIIDLHLSFMERLVEEGIVLQVLERVGISILQGLQISRSLSNRILSYSISSLNSALSYGALMS